jgi:pimeloyl-ACP methyl ester carboxylesterase
MSRWKRVGLLGAVLGTAAAGAAAGFAAERAALGGYRRTPDPAAREPFGRLQGRPRTVIADDGVALHVEEVGEPDAPLTIIFAHGYTLELACWHYQWLGLSGPDSPGRLVFYDQRSHGRSGTSESEHCTVDWLGRDLLRVIEETAPRGPVVLVGHSMGGLTIMALADAHPELFGDRVVGVALVATSAGKLGEVTLGIPAAAAGLLKPVLPRALATLGRRHRIVDRTRSVGSDLSHAIIHWVSYGSEVSPSLVDFMERMVSATSIQVIADFYPTLMAHDKLRALAVLRAVPTLIIVGEQDVLTPAEHSRTMAEAVPSAELVVVPHAGHMIQLEWPALVNLHLRSLIARAQQRSSEEAAS